MEWISLYAATFRHMWTPFIFPIENCEIVRKKIAEHRFIESMLARRDLGIQAEIDWIYRYSHYFKETNASLAAAS